MDYKEVKDILTNQPKEKTFEELCEEYGIEIIDSTLFVNKKILVKDFVKVRELAKSREEINNIIVDAL